MMRAHTVTAWDLSWSAFTHWTRTTLSLDSWSDGTLTDFDNWRPHEPNDAFGGERCANLNIFGGTWNDENCNSVIPFICKRLSSSATKPISTQAPPLINGGCPDPHFKPVPNSNKCYAIINMTKNWQSARDSCRHDYPGSDIASINSITEQEYLTANLQKYSFSVWIGLNKLRHNSKFYWQDNSPFSFQNWAPSEPNSAPSGGKFVRNSEECVEMYTQTAQYVGTWNDKGCQNLRPYVCQISKNAGSIVLSQQGGCPKGFINWRTSCYKYVKSSVTWSDAQTACQSLSATLVIINDVYEDGYVQSMVGCPGCGYWIGLSDQQTSGTYRWVLNWPVYFTNWGAGEPTRATGEGCVAITNNVWNDTNCASTQGYVCEINSVSPPPTTAPPIGHCADPVTQRLVGDYCYYFSRYKTATWPGASYMCQKLGMTLASIHGNDELNFIWNTFLNMHPRPNETTANSPPNVWIGMTKGLSDGFTWADNTAVNFLNWAPNEPSDPLTASNEECVELYTSSGQWNDKDCFTPRKYVCKGRALGVTTAFKLPTQNINNLPPKSSNQPIRPSFPTNPTFPTGPVNPTYPTGPVNPTFPTGPVDPGRPTTRIPYINFPTNAARQRAAPSNNGNGNSTGLSGGSLAGILISCIALLIVVAFGLIFLKRRQSPPVSGPAGGFDNKMYFSTAKNSVQTGGGNSNSGFDDADA